ncbi:MAG TPA: hypothetical protein DCE44_21770, partial [Verrucomicrobiales bacterium]|nr:hypothetical protein [Verrucomicrobiales bacterium]
MHPENHEPSQYSLDLGCRWLTGAENQNHFLPLPSARPESTTRALIPSFEEDGEDCVTAERRPTGCFRRRAANFVHVLSPPPVVNRRAQRGPGAMPGPTCRRRPLLTTISEFALTLAACVSASVFAEPSPLVWNSGPGYRSAPLTVPSTGAAGFTLMPTVTTGVTFTNWLTEASIADNRLLEIGSGVALGDIDGDDRVDIYFCRLDGDNVLYRNLGDWKFEDITVKSGTACPNQFSTGAALVDFDGDGDLDLLVNSLGGGTRAFLNDGRGRFAESSDTGTAREFGATSMALADVDGDGDLDLYVANYRTDTIHDSPRGVKIQTRVRPDGGTEIEPADRFLGLKTPGGGQTVIEKGEPDLLYINRGASRFIPTPWNVGVFTDEDGVALKGPPTDWGLAVLFRDLNGDGLPDLYVCNDFVNWPDRIWLNQGGKRFRAAPRTALRNVSLSSMAVDVADVNRDGHDDIFVADMLSPQREHRAWQRPDTLAGTVNWPYDDPSFRPEVTRNTLHLARGDGTFAEIAQLAGVSASDWTWGVAFLDVDLDGWEDLLLTTGSNHDVQDVDANVEIARGGGWKTRERRLQDWQRLPPRPAPSMAFRNGHDLSFQDRSAAWSFNQIGVAHGMALGDLDNDGDLDVVINCLNAPARLLRNNSPAPRIAVRLKSATRNTRGVGARIKVTGGPVTQTQEMIAGGRYLSSDDTQRVFASGTAQALDLEVIWRNGRRSFVREARPNYLYEVIEEGAAPVEAPPIPAAQPLFQNVSDRLNHIHVDEPFDDFFRQPLLPRKLSALGPGVCWADLDADGDDDLVVGGGRGGRLAILRNNGRGGFSQWTNAPQSQANAWDETGVVTWRGADEITRIAVGESIWEGDATNAAPFRAVRLGEGGAANPWPLIRSESATGPLALADVDGDGDLDLFVGGRAIPGRYPEPAGSQMFRNTGGTFEPGQSLLNLGLVSGAVFTDLDGDGNPDLALACEWDSPRVFRNDHGQFKEVTAALGLAELKGWWNGITSGDFDGDGRMDLLVSNWGRNGRTDLASGMDLPVSLFYGDFAGNGGVQTLLASRDPTLSLVTPWREFSKVKKAIPAVGERLLDHHAYGRASVAAVL